MKLGSLNGLLTIAISLFACGVAGSSFAGDPRGSIEPERGVIVAPGEAQLEERAAESDAAKRLRRARAEHEARRQKAARRIEAERARDREATELQGAVSSLGRRESFLNHERYWTRREFDAISRDPADVSAMARRDNLRRELYDVRDQLRDASGPREAAVRRLDTLRLR